MLQQESHIKQWHLHQEHKLVVVPSSEQSSEQLQCFGVQMARSEFRVH